MDIGIIKCLAEMNFVSGMPLPDVSEEDKQLISQEVEKLKAQYRTKEEAFWDLRNKEILHNKGGF